MKNTFIALITVPLVLLGGSYALGMRIHPEALKQRMGYENRDFRKFNLISGRSFVGEILKENPDSLKVTFEGGAMVFSKSEIASMEPIDPKTAQFGEYADEIVLLPQKQPFITFRKEDAFFYKPPVKKVRYIDSNLKKEEDEETKSSEGQLAKTMEKAMQYAEKSQKRMDERQKEQQEMIAQMEGGE